MPAKIINDRFNSGFFTFIKSKKKISDDELLRRLNIFNYKFLPEESKKLNLETDFPKLYITEVDEWTHIMDDFGYSFMRHLFIFREKDIINNLAKDFEIFQCSVDEAYSGFGFSYYKNGRLQRQYVVRNKKSSFTETYIAKDYGVPFPNEDSVLKENGQLNKVLSFAELAGIKINHELEKIRTYQILDMKI